MDVAVFLCGIPMGIGLAWFLLAAVVAWFSPREQR